MDAALSVPGKPLSANLVSLAYGDKAFDTVESIVRANDVTRKSVRAKDNITAKYVALSQAIMEPHKYPVKEILSGIITTTAPEYPNLVGTDNDKKNKWVRAQAGLKDYLEDFITNHPNSRDAGEAVYQALKNHNICGHPAGRGRNGCAKAQELFGEDFNPTRFQELGIKEYNRKQNAKQALQVNQAKHAMNNDGSDGEAKGVLVQAAEASERGEPWSLAKLNQEKRRLQKAYPYAHEAILNTFSKFEAPKLSPTRAYELLADLGEANNMEFKQTDLDRIPKNTWEMFKGANPEARIVESRIGENVPDKVKKLDGLIDEHVTNTRGQSYIEGSRTKSKWKDDTYAVATLFRRNVFKRARELKDGDAQDRPNNPRSDSVLLQIAFEEEKTLFNEANDPNRDIKEREQSDYYMKSGVGYENALKKENERLNTPSPGLKVIQSIRDDNNELTLREQFSTRQITDSKLLESKDYDLDGDKELAHPTTIAAAIASRLPVIEFIQKERIHAELDDLEVEETAQPALALSNLFGDFGSEDWFEKFYEERNMKDWQAIGNYSGIAVQRANKQAAAVAGVLPEKDFFDWATDVESGLNRITVNTLKPHDVSAALSAAAKKHPKDYEMQIRAAVDILYAEQQPDLRFQIGTEFINIYHSR